MARFRKNRDHLGKIDFKFLEVDVSFLDFAITAHVGWKSKLLEVINHGELPDRSKAAASNQCDFGKWIYSEGQKEYGNIPEFLDVRQKHETFHRAVGSVIDLLIAGKNVEAVALVRTGAYADASHELIEATKKLKSIAKT